MNRILAFALFITALALPALCQPHPRKGPPGGPKTVAKGAPVPEGYVVVAESETSKTIKKPGARETICSGSPVPEDYSIVEQTSSEKCSTAGVNPLTNAMVVANGSESAEKAASSKQTRSSRRDENAAWVGNDREEARLNLLLEQSAEEVNEQARLSLASKAGLVMIGMTMEQVLESWGRPAKIDEYATSVSGTTVTWWYRKGRARAMVEFKEGLVSYYSADY